MSEEQGRNADILQSIVDSTEYTAPPQSRIEDLLLQVKEVIEEGGGTKIRLADVSGAAASSSFNTVSLTWSDPEDIVVSGSTLAKWAGTKVLRKIGSAPESITDGVVVVDSKIKNQYSANGYEDTGLLYDTMYYYRWFPYTEEGVVTDGSAVSVTPARTKITTVPSQSGTLTYNGTEQTASWSNYDPDKMTVTGNTGTNAGTYTAQFTPKADYCWDDDSTTAKAVQWTIGKHSYTVPTQSGSLTYNGTVQTASWSNYDSNAMTVTGNTATNAGNHTAVFSLTDTSNTQWVGGTTSDKNVTWTIGKATGSVTLSTNSVTLNAGAPSATVTATVVGNGTVTATSSDTTIATVSKSGNTFTINNVNQTTGTSTITFNLTATTNYTADSATASVNAVFIEIVTWAHGADEQITAMIQAADAGHIVLSDYWSVGDQRVFSNPSTSWASVGILVQVGTYKDKNDKNVNFVVGFRDCDRNGSSGAYSKVMNDTKTNAGSWRDSKMRTFCNEDIFNKLPEYLRNVIKTVKVVTGDYNGTREGGTNIVTEDKIFLPANKEVQDGVPLSTTNESNALVTFEFYETAANRKKKSQSGGTYTYWWLRSPEADNSTKFVEMTPDGSRSSAYADDIKGVCPHFCI